MTRNQCPDDYKRDGIATVRGAQLVPFVVVAADAVSCLIASRASGPSRSMPIASWHQMCWVFSAFLTALAKSTALPLPQ
jgi:hypothetical protein